MVSKIQEGIFFRQNERPGPSFAILFFNFEKSCEADEAGMALITLWKKFESLRNGIKYEINKDYVPHLEKLSITIGYGINTFSVKGANRSAPRSLSDGFLLNPHSYGGGPVVDNSDLFYGETITYNHAASCDFVIQFIGETEFIVNQAIVETWKQLIDINSESPRLHLIKFYKGFGRSDNRSLIGFHDGISNLKTSERKQVIALDSSKLDTSERWTINATYLMFMRIIIKLEDWWGLSIQDQEIVIGREKLTGCPIIGLDLDGNPVKQDNCPISGTKDVTKSGNEVFRDHPSYGMQKYLRSSLSDRQLELSHIGSMRKNGNIPSWEEKSGRIFRQGFEFLESTDSYPWIRAGLNFVSFQNSPSRIVSTLTAWSKNKNVYDKTKYKHQLKFNKYLSVESAGLFFVAPIEEEDFFPGSSIFLTNTKLKDHYRTI